MNQKSWMYLFTQGKENEYSHKTQIQTFTALLFLMFPNYKQPKCLSTDERLNQMVSICLPKHNCTITKNKTVYTYNS